MFLFYVHLIIKNLNIHDSFDSDGNGKATALGALINPRFVITAANWICSLVKYRSVFYL